MWRILFRREGHVLVLVVWEQLRWWLQWIQKGGDDSSSMMLSSWSWMIGYNVPLLLMSPLSSSLSSLLSSTLLWRALNSCSAHWEWRQIIQQRTKSTKQHERGMEFVDGQPAIFEKSGYDTLKISHTIVQTDLFGSFFLRSSELSNAICRTSHRHHRHLSSSINQSKRRKTERVIIDK